MPKEYINFPQEQRVAYALTEKDIADGKDAVEILPPGPQVGLHWDARHGTVQLSLDIDWGVLQRIVDYRRKEGYEPEGSPTREVIYTESLSRADLQRLIKQTRRARDAAFGADE